MKFKINNDKWEIKELDTRTLCERFDGDENEFLYGFCSYTENVIYLNNMLTLDRKRNTLIHELTHCWTMSNGWGFSGDTDRETICNIVACSNYFINDITNKYFNRRREMKNEPRRAIRR